MPVQSTAVRGTFAETCSNSTEGHEQMLKLASIFAAVFVAGLGSIALGCGALVEHFKGG